MVGGPLEEIVSRGTQAVFHVGVFVAFLAAVIGVWQTRLPTVAKFAVEFVLLVVAVAVTFPRGPGAARPN